jgi:RNA polymerase sigma factor (sigma-70 family)
MAIGHIEAVRSPLEGQLDARTVAEVNDGHLLARFIADRGELAEIAFAALVRRHGPMVLRVCEQVVGDRHTAEDAFQATFLILARRAGSIHQPELLGQWLHGVALRTAREARMQAHRRRERESSRIDGVAPEPIDQTGRPDVVLICREEFEALHQEVSRLPERYRIPVVLCDLEGLTYQDAARRLGCPVGTIGVRLRRARERLRVRMTRRGLAPTASVLVALLGAEVVSARVPSTLIESTVAAAMGFAARNAAATELASTSVIAVTETVLRAMAASRIKLAMNLAVGVGIAATIGWAVLFQQTSVAVLPVTTISQPAAEQPAPLNAALPEQPMPNNHARALEELAGRPAADGAIDLLAGGDEVKPAAKTSADSAVPGPQEEVAIDEKPPFKKPVPETELAAYAGRLIRDEEARGEVLFVKEWVPNDPRSHAGDGLGPVYNETSCVACHGLGSPGGAGPESKNVVLITANPNGCGTTTGLDKFHPGFRGSRSAVLHRFGTEHQYASWRRRFIGSSKNDPSNPPPIRGEASINSRIQALKEQTTPDHRVRERSPSLESVNGFSLSLAERNTPPLFGIGRIDEIPSQVIIDKAAGQSDAIRGRVSRTREGRVGRFGWKAQVASLHEFVRGACANELGLEVPGHSQAPSPVAPSSKPPGLDLTEADCDAMVAYVRSLPAPVVVDPSGPQGTDDMRAGRVLFAEVGCAACHTPVLGDVKGIYSDLLLHDMGQSLSDSGSSYGIDGPSSPVGPSAREWRTPPLWGYRDSGPYLHDGRAQNLAEAIALHDGQARASAHRYFGLNSLERAQVEVFLKSLVAPAAAAAPGIALATEMEARGEQKGWRAPEALVRRRRDWAVARDEQEFRAAQERRRAQEAARRARAQIPLARSLERMGKITGALAFYQEIARDASGTEEGKLAAAKVSALSTRKGSR